MARQECTFDPPHFDKFYNHIYPALVAYFVRRGVRRAEAEELAHEVLLRFMCDYRSGAERIIDPVGWIYHSAAWRLRDWARRHVRSKEISFSAKDSEVPRVNPHAHSAKITTILHAREIVQRGYERFFRTFESKAKGNGIVVRAIRYLVERQEPNDRVQQYLLARILVFSGKNEDDEKRDSSDIKTVAGELGITTGALQTKLTRLQPIWTACESEIFCESSEQFSARSGT